MQDFSLAEQHIDKLFKYFPTYESFSLSDLIRKSDLLSEEQKLALNNDAVEIMLVDRLKYADKSDKAGFTFKLNTLGREVQNAGGHFKYIKKLSEKEVVKNERQKLNDKKLSAEIDIVEFQRGLGKRLTIWGFVVGVLSVVASVLATVWTNHDDTQKSFHFDTASLKKQLQNLEQRLQNEEHKKLLDTVPQH